MSSRKQKNKKAYKEKRAAHLARKRKEKVLFQITGRVQMTREGFCFVIPETLDDIAPVQTAADPVTDVFVKANKAHGALNGDRVVVDVTRMASSGGTGRNGRDGAGKSGGRGAGRGSDKPKADRCEGVITQIIERSPKPFVGFLHIVGNQAWVLMQSKVMPYDISVKEIPDGAKQGYKVAAVVDDWPRGESNPIGHIVDVLGEPGENDTEMHAILAEFGLPYRFEPDVEKEAESIKTEITKDDIKGRKDFRDVLTFTIDPVDAKDFDDALSYCKLPNGNTQVGVHIADVTYYVKPGSKVDKEAQARGTSVYLVDRTVPMLPEKLCNTLCSLRPNEDKLTFSAVFELTPDARVVKQWFGRTVIRSDYRFDYDQAQAIITAGNAIGVLTPCGCVDGAQAPAGSEAETAIETAVRELWDLASKLRKARFASGAISFERPEMKVLCDEKGRPVDVVQKVSFEANWLIEEFMLLANRSVTEFVATQHRDSTFVYRVHDEPNQEKLENLRTFVKTFGYKLAPDLGGMKVAEELNRLFDKAKDTPESSAIELMSLRCMAKAKYDVDNIGHFGLAFKYYTHFTSPIRRYPDMMVHRLLADYLQGGKSADKAYYAGQCKHASEREQVAADAERASVKYKLVEYMQDKVGYTYDGTVSGLTDWGMYVEVLPTHIEGMVPLRDIKSDFFEFDEARYQIKGRHTKKIYTMGSPVKIRVTRADLDQKQIDYELIED